ncbi:hypothetical protein M513_11647 [Trichuris suis]|uniref:GIY-YIG domain-containing protein n=1 Tax=Trichuris suis TaxID=68888 RepID=A0A085LR90_9BILA|nr:hypothetical protein M513_11647 [Trichuris suis]
MFHEDFSENGREWASHWGSIILLEEPFLEPEVVSFLHAKGNQFEDMERTEICPMPEIDVCHDKIKVPLDERPGVVYKVTCCCNASYIGETGNTLLRRFNQHVDALNRYMRALIKLNGQQRTGPDLNDSQRDEGTTTTQRKGRGRPPKKKQTTKTQRNPAKTMADAIKKAQRPFNIPLNAHSTSDQRSFVARTNFPYEE